MVFQQYKIKPNVPSTSAMAVTNFIISITLASIVIFFILNIGFLKNIFEYLRRPLRL